MVTRGMCYLYPSNSMGVAYKLAHMSNQKISNKQLLRVSTVANGSAWELCITEVEETSLFQAFQEQCCSL